VTVRPPEGLAGGHPSGRRFARPRPGRRLPAALPLARLAAKLAPAQARAVAAASRSGSLEDVRACKSSLLVTFRRDGTPVPTPAWAAEREDRLYVRSERSSGKVKRLRGDARMLIAPSTGRGRPLGAPLEAFARVLAADEEAGAERVLADRYGFGRWLFELTVDLLRVDMCYLEITPAEWGEEPPASAPV
jgi:PPOX class probable F420-dependent enzyme